MDLLKSAMFVLLTFINHSLSMEYRLPPTVLPTFYDLYLNIDPRNSSYSGSVTIKFFTSTISDGVYIHDDGDYIEIGLAELNDNPCSYNSADIPEVVKIYCQKGPKVGSENSLYLEFTGKFSLEDGYGLVKNSYLDGEDEQILVESNFKPIFARRAFPCLDEPDLKAAFSVEITHPKDYNALSNSPVVNITDVSDDLRTTKFENTPAISTYLLSIFLSKFKEAESATEDNVDFKIFTRKEVANLSQNIAYTYYPQIIKKLDSYTGVPYANLSDIESYFVAIPDNTDTMGGFGLFAVRESDILDEGNKTTSRVKQDIISTMVYKLSHEWYGGDVSTKWWSDVWANEAVATYMKYVISNEVDEEMELMNQFLLEITQKMLQYDAYPFAQPLSSSELDISTDWAIENKLNTGVYEKGASILHMINVVLGGNENFQSALQSHWKRRKEADTNGTDILKDLLDGKVDDYGTEYYSYIEKWAFSPGFPLITVTMKEEDDGFDIANINQKRFLYPTEENNVEEESTWYIPLTSSTMASDQSKVSVDVFLQPDNEMMYFFGNTTWMIFNNQGSCFYRVNYDEQLWRRILDGLYSDRSQFHVLQRAQMIDDIFNIARIGDVNYTLAFEMAGSFFNETEYYPWYSMLNAFSYLLGKMADAQVEWNLKNYILNLMENVIKIPNDTFVDDSDKHMDVIKKVMILDWACKLGHDGCITYTTEKYNRYKESQSSLEDFNAREIIFCNGIRHSESVNDDWDFLWNVYGNSSSVHEQNDILKALGCAEDKLLLLSYLQKLITANSGIKRQDVLVVIRSVLTTSLGLETAMEFLENNLSQIQNIYKDMRILSEMVYIIAEKLVTDDQINWLNDLLKDESLNDYEDVKSKATTLALVNNYWQNNFQGDITDILPSFPSSTWSTTTESKGENISVSYYVLVIFITPFVVSNF